MPNAPVLGSSSRNGKGIVGNRCEISPYVVRDDFNLRLYAASITRSKTVTIEKVTPDHIF